MIDTTKQTPVTRGWLESVGFTGEKLTGARSSSAIQWFKDSKRGRVCIVENNSEWWMQYRDIGSFPKRNHGFTQERLRGLWMFLTGEELKPAKG